MVDLIYTIKKTRNCGSFLLYKQSVRMTGVEPACLTAPDPKSGTSANFATSAFIYIRGGVPPTKGGKNRGF